MRGSISVSVFWVFLGTMMALGAVLLVMGLMRV